MTAAVMPPGCCGYCCAAPRQGSHSSAMCYARAAEGDAGDEERGRGEGTGEGAKEVARAGGGEAAGIWVIGGRGGRGRAMEERV